MGLDQGREGLDVGRGPRRVDLLPDGGSVSGTTQA
jgi:hypothetical protein